MGSSGGGWLATDRRAGALVVSVTGDLVLDVAAGALDARAAAAVLYGPDRATRSVAGALAQALLGPPPARGTGPRPPAWWATSVLLALDDPRERTAAGTAAQAGTTPHGALARDDLVAVLEAAAGSATAADLPPLRPVERHALTSLVAGWPRPVRRRLALALVGDERLRIGALRAALEALAAAPALALPVPSGTLHTLVDDAVALAGARLPERAVVAAGPVRHLLPGGVDLRLPVTQGQLQVEGRAFANCLERRWPAVREGTATIATVRRGTAPVAAAELDVAGELTTVLGPANRWLDPAVARDIEALLVTVGVLEAPAPLRPLTAGERAAARVACRAAVLLLADDPPDPPEPFWPDPGPSDAERMLEQLGPRARLLAGAELTALRHLGEPAATGGPGTQVAGAGAELPDPVHGWRVVAAMLTLLGAPDPVLGDPGGGAPCRLAAAAAGRQLLAGTLALPARAPSTSVRALPSDPSLPAWGREAAAEVVRCWWPWG